MWKRCRVRGAMGCQGFLVRQDLPVRRGSRVRRESVAPLDKGDLLGSKALLGNRGRRGREATQESWGGKDNRALQGSRAIQERWGPLEFTV